MHKLLEAQLLTEQSDSLKEVKSGIMATVLGSSVMQGEALAVSNALFTAMHGKIKNVFLSDQFNNELRTKVLSVLGTIICGGYGLTVPLQQVASEVRKELDIEDFHEGFLVAMELVTAVAMKSNFAKCVTTAEGSCYIVSLLEHEEMSCALINAKHPRPSLIPLKHMNDLSDNAYRTSNGYRAMLGSSFNDRKGDAPMWCVNYLGSIAFSIEDWTHDTRPPKRNKRLEAGERVSPDVLEQMEVNSNLHILESARACNYLMANGNVFYFAHSFDKRLRAYSKGHQLNLQGEEYDKSLIEFANKEELTVEGLAWLRVGIANAYGLDKETFTFRKLWAITNESSLESLTAQADEPLIYAQRVRALRNHQAGKAIGTIVQIDCTASGLQVNGAFTACEETLLASNVLANTAGKRMDVYTQIHDWLKTECEELPALSRTLVKDATVPAMYASEAEPKRVFGEYVDYFWEAFAQMPGGYWYLKTLPQLWNDRIEEYSFTMPDGYVVYIPVTGTVDHKVRMETTGKVVNIATEVQGRKSRSKCFLANITHAFDAYILRNIVDRCYVENIDITVIHDSYGVHPNNCSKIVEWYKEELADLIRLDPLPAILKEIFNVNVTIPTFSSMTRDELADMVMDGEFALS